MTLLLAIVGCGGGGRENPVPPPPGRALPGGIAAAIANTSDDGFVIAGTSSPGANGGSDLLLMKLDAAGNVAWKKDHGGTGDESGWSVRQTGDGGYIVAGRTDDPTLAGGPGGIYVVKTDAHGDPLWHKTFGGVLSPRHGKVAARETGDGGYIVAGTVPEPDPFTEPDAFIVKTNGLGEMQWRRAFGTAGNMWWEAYDVLETVGGGGIGYILVGQREGASGFESYAARVAPDGTGGASMEWEQAFGAHAGPIHSVEETPDGYVYIGRNDTAAGCAALLVKGGAGGELVWEKTVGTLTSCPALVNGQRAADGGYILVTGGNAGNGDAYVIRADGSGNELWSKLYGGNGGDYAAGVVERADGGFVVAGGTTSFGDTPSVYLLQLDAGGTPR